MTLLPLALRLICTAVLGLPSLSDARTASDGATLALTGSGVSRHHHRTHRQWLLAAEAAPASVAPSPSPGPAGAVQTELRPGLGGGPDVIDFGVLVTSLGAISETDGSFSADIVLLLRWRDQRTRALVPDGVQVLTLASDGAASKMWLPDVTVTNRVIGGQEIISSAISITANGEVTKTERMVVVCKNDFHMGPFPFDTQHLNLIIASTTLMMDDLQLSPIRDKKISGVKTGVFDPYDLVLDKVKARSFDEVDGTLRKSRGELRVTVHRDWQLYMRKKLLPELFLVFISWTVFYFPLQPHFAMPRVATSLIAFLSMMTVSSKNNHGGCERWLDVFEEACMTMLFLTVFLNIFVEIVNHSFGAAPVAERMDHELKLVLPLLTSVIFIILFVFNQCSVTWLSLITRVISALGPVGYIAVCLVRFKEIKEGAKKVLLKHREYSAAVGGTKSEV